MLVFDIAKSKGSATIRFNHTMVRALNPQTPSFILMACQTMPTECQQVGLDEMAVADPVD